MTKLVLLLLWLFIGFLLCKLVDKIKLEIQFYNMFKTDKHMTRLIFGDRIPLFYYFVYDVKEERRKELRRKEIISLKANYLYRLLSRDCVNKEKLFKLGLRHCAKIFNKLELALLLELFVDKIQENDREVLEKVCKSCRGYCKDSLVPMLYDEIKALDN